MNWLTITTTLIAAIAPSVVSIVTLCLQQRTNKKNNELQLEINKLNNEHQLKLKQFELYKSPKNSSINCYLDNLIQYLNNPSSENFINYQFSMAKASMYVSAKIYSEIDDINTAIQNNKIDDVKKSYFSSLLDAINADAKDSD